VLVPAQRDESSYVMCILCVCVCVYVCVCACLCVWVCVGVCVCECVSSDLNTEMVRIPFQQRFQSHRMHFAPVLCDLLCVTASYAVCTCAV